MNHLAAAERLILAKLNNDEHAVEIVAAEIGDCLHCWRIIAEDLAQTLAIRAIFQVGPERAIASSENIIAYSLDLDPQAET